MYHSITFGDKNTWDDWHLIPTTRPVVNPPLVKTSMIDIPGGDGQIDLSTALSGRPLFTNRAGSLEFIVENGFREWHALYSEIMLYLHGQRMRMTLEDDPAYFYEGRFSVNQWKSDKNFSLITIDYDVGPYKLSMTGTLEDWLWDLFNFETGIVQENLGEIEVDGERTVVVVGSPVSMVSPRIISSTDGMTVTYKGVSYPLRSGSNIMHSMKIDPGRNEFTFVGTGTITVDYRGGAL